MSAEKFTGFEAQKPTNRPRVLVFGCGYLGERVALEALRRGDEVFATTRNDAKAQRLAGLGVTPVIANWVDNRTLRCLPQVDRVLVAVSYDARDRFDRYESQVGGFSNLLCNLSSGAEVCYISTTGVYHQLDGSWVDEYSPARPSRDGGRAHLDAEALLWRRRPHARWTILRLAGIYGPGRVPRAHDVIAGRPIPAPAGGYLNLIHVDDAVTAVLASWGSPRERMYVVADDRPVLRTEFYSEIARQCRVQPPLFTESEPAPPRRFRSETNKRIWNCRLKRDLVPRLRFPTYREGLRDVLADYPRRS